MTKIQVEFCNKGWIFIGIGIAKGDYILGFGIISIRIKKER